jgi:hypothetical protein
VLKSDERSTISGVLGSMSLGDVVELCSLTISFGAGKAILKDPKGKGVRGYLVCGIAELIEQLGCYAPAVVYYILKKLYSMNCSGTRAIFWIAVREFDDRCQYLGSRLDNVIQRYRAPLVSAYISQVCKGLIDG